MRFMPLTLVGLLYLPYAAEAQTAVMPGTPKSTHPLPATQALKTSDGVSRSSERARDRITHPLPRRYLPLSRTGAVTLAITDDRIAYELWLHPDLRL